jgi:hypothetical protein
MTIQSCKPLDPLEIKKLAEPGNRPGNIAHRRGKHGIALYCAAVTFPPDLGFGTIDRSRRALDCGSGAAERH